MKAWLKNCLLAVFMGVLLPMTVVGVWYQRKLPGEKTEIPTLTAPATEETEEIMTERERKITVLFGDGSQTEMGLDNYITGVVLAEMPVSFEPEALKAQAIVSRTYALRRCILGGKHPGGAVCTDPSCCQGYVSPDRAVEGAKIAEKAVNATAGLVLTYEGELIDATYFSCSGGSTEDAEAVWGNSVPYLRATDSPGEEWAEVFSEETFFDRASFCEALDIPEGDWNRIGPTTYTQGGGIAYTEIGGTRFTGVELRRLLHLPSTMINMVPTENGVIILTKGYGHRVGMSQYGADAMAASGANFEEILLHYYSGTRIETWDWEN